MYSQLERYIVQKLRQRDVPVHQVSDLTGVSQRSIIRMDQEAPINEIDEPTFRKSRKMGRPSAVAQYEEQIRQWLEEPRNPEDGPPKSQEILARLRQQGYSGGKTAAYELIKQLRPQVPPKPIAAELIVRTPV